MPWLPLMNMQSPAQRRREHSFKTQDPRPTSPIPPGTSSRRDHGHPARYRWQANFRYSAIPQALRCRHGLPGGDNRRRAFRGFLRGYAAAWEPGEFVARGGDASATTNPRQYAHRSSHVKGAVSSIPQGFSSGIKPTPCRNLQPHKRSRYQLKLGTALQQPTVTAAPACRASIRVCSAVGRLAA